MVVLAPFANKAYTVDDNIFLSQAQHVTTDPLHPTAFDIVSGDTPGRLGLASGPIMAWLLVPAVLAGGAEWVAHLVQMAMLALAVFATVGLAIHLGLAPFWAMIAGLLLASTPTALGMAGTVMPDIPAMALGVLGLERLVAWSQEKRPRQAVLAVIALGLAPLTRPHLFLLLGIGALVLVGNLFERSNWRSDPSRWVPIAAAPLLTAALAFLVRDPDPSGRGIIAATASVSSLVSVGPNLVAFPIHWVLALPLAVPWTLLRPKSVITRWWFLVLVAAAATFGLHGFKRPSLPLAAIAGLGAAVLWDIGADAWKRRDPVQLVLGLWLLVALATAPYPHLPAKYLLASAPAAALLIARELSAAGRSRWRIVLGITCALSVALGVAILRADAAFADIGRRAAAELISPNVAMGHRVWFAGHWGFQWYAEKAGGTIVTLTPPYPLPGDLLVTSINSEPSEDLLSMLRERYPRSRHLARIEDRAPGGRIMDARVGAGFFSHGWGYLPWAWGHDPLDTCDLWRLE